MTAPESVRVRAYQVGYADCLLLTLTYPDALDDGRRERHVLVDFGAKLRQRDAPAPVRLAELVAEHCGGQLDVVVVTHRQLEHLQGFGEAKAAKHLRPLHPKRIIRPWTDRPKDDHPADLDGRSKAFTSLLRELGDHDAAVHATFEEDGSGVGRRLAGLAKRGAADREAQEMLASWTELDHTQWVKAGDPLDLQELLPGVVGRVVAPSTLGPNGDRSAFVSPSGDGWLSMADQELIAPELVKTDDDKLWAAKQVVAAPEGLGGVGWLVDKMHESGPEQALTIVEGFSEALGNSSVVLLLAVGDRTLLLAGDAQVESWARVLDRALGENDVDCDPELRRALAKVDLYKVGHHGSGVGTPQRLVRLWSVERPNPTAGFVSVLSTRPGAYGTSAQGKVPNASLVRALTALGPVRSTADLEKGVWWFDVEAPADGRDVTWTYRPGPSQKVGNEPGEESPG